MTNFDFSTRRTIRSYSDKDIPSDLLNSMLEVASRASTTGNMQLYSVVVTRDCQRKELLSPLHFNQPMIKNAPVVLTFCVDYNRFSKWCECSNAKPGYNNFHSFISAALDTTIFAQQFCAIAESKGLGICYIGTTTYNAKGIIDVLNLPKLTVPLITITLGYPEVIPPLTDRLPINGIIHNEVYNDYSPEMIKDIYSYKESLEESKKFIAENNKETLAQIFTDIRYKESDNIHFSEEFMNVLKNQGFL
ncbi:MAG: nitroreductase family protein [Bacteroidales bacterium]|nr:nitroreductase family protein [Bacteroidales bacterium]